MLVRSESVWRLQTLVLDRDDVVVIVVNADLVACFQRFADVAIDSNDGLLIVFGYDSEVAFVGGLVITLIDQVLGDAPFWFAISFPNTSFSSQMKPSYISPSGILPPGKSAPVGKSTA